MNEQLKESLSALMDDEATELELRQVLRSDQESILRESWSRWHMVRAALAEPASQLAPAGLGEAIIAALDSEAPPRRGLGAVSGALRGLAVAAGVAVVAVLGVRGLEGPAPEPATAPVVASVPAEGIRVYQPGMFRSGNDRASYAQASVVNPNETLQSGEPAAGQLAAQRRLQHFMYRHAEYASLNSSRGMMPFARVTSHVER